MTNVYSLNNDDAILDQASAWIAKMDRNLSQQEFEEFREWLLQNELHQKLIIEMTSIWDKMDSLESLSSIFFS